MHTYCGSGMALPTITFGDRESAVPFLIKTFGGTQYDSGWVPEPVWAH